MPSVGISVNIPARAKKQIDALVDDAFFQTRSAFFKKALEEYLDREEFLAEQIF